MVAVKEELVSRNDLEKHAETYIRMLVEKNEAGAYVDIPEEGGDIQKFRAAVTLWCGRLIRKPLGNRNGTYQMSSSVRPGFIRITLDRKIP